MASNNSGGAVLPCSGREPFRQSFKATGKHLQYILETDSLEKDQRLAGRLHLLLIVVVFVQFQLLLYLFSVLNRF